MVRAKRLSCASRAAWQSAKVAFLIGSVRVTSLPQYVNNVNSDPSTLRILLLRTGTRKLGIKVGTFIGHGGDFLLCSAVLLRHVLLSCGLLPWHAAHMVVAVTSLMGVVAHTVIADTLKVLVSGSYRRSCCVELADVLLFSSRSQRRIWLKVVALASWLVPVQGPARQVFNWQPRCVKLADCSSFFESH